MAAQTNDLSWVRRLDEVGNPILNRLAVIEEKHEDIAALEARVAAMKKTAEADTAALLNRIREQWDNEEIARAGGPALS